MGQTAAILVAAGRGTRAGGELPKQYRILGGRPVLWYSLQALASSTRINVIVPVIHSDDGERFQQVRDSLPDTLRRKIMPAVPGAASRQGSVLAGLEALAAVGPDSVVIHDAARPFLTAALIERMCAAVERHEAGVPGVAMVDTIKRIDVAGLVRETPKRAALRAIQTPQAFRFPALLTAHRRAAAEGRSDFTDDGAVAEWAGMAVYVVEGDRGNIKLTTPEDFAMAEQHLASPASGLISKSAGGYDVHAFADGDHVWIGGIRIAHDRGVAAHSDGDVVLHALTDALLGALADGDIGQHFPPSDPQWKDASSDRFLAFAAERVRERGGIIDHLDATIVCESPKIGPHREAMRARIAAIAGVASGAVSIKATTSERLGFTGRKEGIAAQAIVSVRLPAPIS